jgi:DNA-binding MarR family transcriptional regulator
VQEQTGPESERWNPDEISRLRLAVLRLARRLRSERPAGITPSQQSALATIEHHGPLTLGELADLEQVRPPSISRIVGALEGEGWVERTAVEGDRRIALVSTTPKARRELQRARARRNQWIHERLTGLDPDGQARLLAALDVLEHLAEGTADGERPAPRPEPRP